MQMAYEYDDFDKKVIQGVIDAYDKVFPTGPDSIAMSVLSATQEQAELRASGKVGRTGVKTGNEADMRLSLAIPQRLLLMIRKKEVGGVRVYNNLLTKKNIGWFRKNFPMFIVNK